MIQLRLLSLAFIGVVGLVYTVYQQRSKNYASSHNSNNPSPGSSPKPSSEEKCVICEKLPSEEKTFKLQCGHNLHLACAFIACCIGEKKNCLKPNCSHEITPHEKSGILHIYSNLNPKHFKM